MALIDKMSLIERLEKAYCAGADKVRDIWLVEFNQWINEQPIIDAVEVVRCKDCAWFHLKGDGCPCGHGTCSMITGEIMSEDFYCADGKRRESEVSE